MPFNPSGIFQRLYSWASDRDAGIDIDADRMDAETDGIVSAVNAITAGDQPFRSPIRVPLGITPSPGYTFEGDANTGLARVGADAVALVTGGTARAIARAAEFEVNVPITGTAVQADKDDLDPGKLLVRFEGGPPIIGNVGVTDGSIASGAYSYRTHLGSSGGPAGCTHGSLMHQRIHGESLHETQEIIVAEGTGYAAPGSKWTRSRATAAWEPWRSSDLHSEGSNANGRWRRWCDGRVWCVSPEFVGDTAPIADVHRTFRRVWTFPIAFAEAPFDVRAMAADPERTWAVGYATGTTGADSYAFCVSAQTNRRWRLTAEGRW